MNSNAGCASVVAVGLFLTLDAGLAQQYRPPTMPAPVGGTNPLNVSDLAGRVLMPQDFGIVRDRETNTNGTIASGSNTWTTSAAQFLPCDDGSCGSNLPAKQFVADGLGSSGASQQGSIVQVIDSQHVVLSFTAGRQAPLYGIAGATISAQGTGYMPGDYVRPIGVTGQIVQGGLLVFSTQVLTSSIVSAGTGGPVSGTCTIQGTTGYYVVRGNRTTFTETVITNSSGAIATLGSITYAGIYTGSPNTGSTPEPVVPATTGNTPCTGLTGATLSIGTGPDELFTTTASFGEYSVPVTFTGTYTTSTTGTGTGLTLKQLRRVQLDGNYNYGTDDSPGWASMFSFANSLLSIGIRPSIYVPSGQCSAATSESCSGSLASGDSFIGTTAMPALMGPVSIRCESRPGGIFYISPNYPGVGPAKAFIGFANTYLPFAAGFGAVSADGGGTSGPEVTGCSFTGDLTAPNTQTAIAVYDSSALVHLNFNNFLYLNGPGIAWGITYLTGVAHVRESRLFDNYFYAVGNATYAAMDLAVADNSGNTGIDDIRLDHNEFVQSGCEALAIHGTTGSGAGYIFLGAIRAEQTAYNPNLTSCDTIRLGGTATGDGARITEIYGGPFQIPSIEQGGSGIHVAVSPDQTLFPYGMTFRDGAIGGGTSYGTGITIDAGSDINIAVDSIITNGNAFATGAASGLAGIDVCLNASTANYLTAIDPAFTVTKCHVLSYPVGTLDTVNAVAQSSPTTYTPTAEPSSGAWDTITQSGSGTLYGSGVGAAYEFTVTFTPTFGGAGAAAGPIEVSIPCTPVLGTNLAFPLRSLTAVPWPPSGSSTQVQFEPASNQTYGNVEFLRSGSQIPAGALTVSGLTSGGTYTIAGWGICD